MRQQATREGLVPLKAWVKNALDHVICVCMNEPGLEFVWVGDDAIDPLEQAQTLQILVGAGIKTREEARADLGLAPTDGAPGKAPAGLGKYNQNHDERGRFSTADNAGPGAGRKPASSPKAPDSTGGRSSHSPASALAGTLIDKRYDENLKLTHCTYRTPLGTYTLEIKGHIPVNQQRPRGYDLHPQLL
jgi:hypothetical protein